MNAASVPVPVHVRLRLGHAAAQVVATRAGVDLLHIKGVVADPGLPATGSSDADLLVRPSQAGRYVESLVSAGWRQSTGFRTGSPFRHAATLWHPEWAHADVHRFFPGMDPGEATFDALWSQRGVRDVAGVAICVPARPAQVLIHVLNGVRNGQLVRHEPVLEGLLADPELATEVGALVEVVGAQIAYAAAHGTLERHAAEPAADLWRITAEGGTRVEEWRARVRAAPGLWAKVELVASSALVNTEHLAELLGRQPSRGEVIREFFDRPRRGLVEQLRRRTSGR